MLSKNIKIILLLCIVIISVATGIYLVKRPSPSNAVATNVPASLTEDERTFLTVFYPEDKSGENKSIDMRVTIQSLVDRYDSLDDYTKEKLFEILFPESITTARSGIFSRTVYADEELYPMFEYDLGIEGICLRSHDPSVASENSEFLTELILQAYMTFEDLGFYRPEFKVEIISTSIDEFIGSYSVMLPDEFAGIVTNAIYKIYIDFNSDPLTLEARIIHELFHAFQEEAMKSHIYGVVNDDFINWLKEATAIWAIDQVSPDNDFELEFTESLYKIPMIEYYSLTGYDYYTWYQLFFYFTEILDAESYVDKLFSQYRFYLNADTLFSNAHQSRMLLNKDFATLGMTLFHPDKDHLKFQTAEPFYPDLRIEISDENTSDLSEMTDEANDPWREETFSKPGFSYKLITIPEDFDGKISVSQSLSMVTEEQMTGMRIAVNRSGNWEWEHFTFEPAVHVIDIGQSMDIIDSIVIMFFSTGFEDFETVKYKITTGQSTGADGIITVKWEKIYAFENDDSFEREIITTIISEELEKTQAGEDNSFYATIKEISLGDSYNIKNMSINYIYDYTKKENDTQEKLLGYGTYDFNSDSRSESIPGLGDLKGSLDELKSLLEDASENLKDLPGMEDYKEFIPELPEIPDMDLSLPSSGLSRIIIRPELGVFEIHPTIPAEIYSSDWVEYEYTIKSPDPDDSAKSVTQTNKYSGRCSEFFPLWFVNPDYSENLSMEDMEKEFGEAEETDELMNKIVNLQETLNRLNIKKLIDNPGIYYQIDPNEFMDPVPESGTIEEKAMFNNKEFKSEIKVSVITGKGNRINLTINLDYSFK